MVFETGDKDEFEGMAEDEFNALEPGDLVVHVHDAPDSATVKNDDLDVIEGRELRKVIKVGDYNPLAGGRTNVEVQGGTIGRNNLNKWAVVDSEGQQ